MSLTFLLLAAADGPAYLSGKDAAIAASKPVVEQMINDGIDHYYFTDSTGAASASFRTKPRPSSEAGICESDKITITRAPTSGLSYYSSLPGAIREVKSEREYRILTVSGEQGDDAKPAWELSGEPLIHACANLPSDGKIWVQAEHQTDVRFGWHALSQIKRELARGKSKKIIFSCRFGSTNCDLADTRQIEIKPLQPTLLREENDRTGCEEEDVRCYRFYAHASGSCGYYWIGHFRLSYKSRWRKDKDQLDETYELLSAEFEKTPSSSGCPDYSDPEE
jgi:hypothetical protein